MEREQSQSRSTPVLLVIIVFLGILIGVVGGGLMGGLAGYYVVLTRAQPITASQAATAIPLAATTQSPAITDVTLQQSSAVIDVVKKVEPAVVTVVNKMSGQLTPFGRVSPTASGSGVIIDQQGHIITNNHVVEQATSLEVILHDGTTVPVTLVGADPVSDLAVLQLDKTPPAFAPLGDSSSLQLGEMVIAIGSPLGNYRGSVTMGVISGLNRSVEGADQEGLIQTDAAINHGNSGGPLINLLGQVIGINTLVVRDTSSGDVAEGLGFSIPSATVATISEQLISKGKAEYPYIGISYVPITPQTAGEFNYPTQSGIVITQVVPSSPAGRAGIQEDDIVLAIDSSPIDESHSLRSILFKYKAGDKVKLRVLRDGKTSDVEVTLVVRPGQVQ